MFDDYTRLTEGQPCPVTTIGTVKGEQISLPDATTAKPFMINFFIAKCRHCSKALHFVEDHIWKTLGNRIEIISICRSHTQDEVEELQRDKGWNFTLAADPDRTIYDLFAEKKVPRTYLFNGKGELVHQVRGYNEEEYFDLKEIILGLIGDSGSSPE